MQSTLSLRHQLTSIFWARADKQFIKNTLVVILSSILLALAAQIQIPLQPIPITLQNFTVLLISMAIGWRLGTLAVALYLLEGALGLPFFANHLGLAELFGPTGGYLVGFLLAAFVCGTLIEKGWGRFTTTALLAALIGFSIVFLCGLLILTHFVGFSQALTLGLYPFVLTDLAKCLLLAMLIPFFWRRQQTR